MPKVHNTRKQRAAELLKTVQDGPSFGDIGDTSETMTAATAANQYRIWSNSWIIPALKELVPELKEENKWCSKN